MIFHLITVMRKLTKLIIKYQIFEAYIKET